MRALDGEFAAAVEAAVAYRERGLDGGVWRLSGPVLAPHATADDVPQMRNEFIPRLWRYVPLDDEPGEATLGLDGGDDLPGGERGDELHVELSYWRLALVLLRLIGVLWRLALGWLFAVFWLRYPIHA